MSLPGRPCHGKGKYSRTYALATFFFPQEAAHIHAIREMRRVPAMEVEPSTASASTEASTNEPDAVGTAAEGATAGEPADVDEAQANTDTGEARAPAAEDGEDDGAEDRPDAESAAANIEAAEESADSNNIQSAASAAELPAAESSRRNRGRSWHRCRMTALQQPVPYVRAALPN